MEKMAEQLKERWYQKTTGYTDFVEIKPGGEKDGIPYGPAGYQVVILGKSCVAYRYSSDSSNGTWGIGTPEVVAGLVVD